MFYLVNLPVTSTSLKQIVDIQVCMIRILSRLHLETLQVITSEYLVILKGIFIESKSVNTKSRYLLANFDLFLELISFCKNNSVNMIIMEKFTVNPTAIEKLDLHPFPVKVTNVNVSIFQISILKVKDLIVPKYFINA